MSVRGSRQITIHPLLFAAFPVLSFFEANRWGFDFPVVWRPILWNLVGVCALWAVARLLISDTRRSAIPVSFVALTFFSFKSLHVVISSISAGQGLDNVGSGNIFVCGSYLAALIAILLFLNRPNRIGQVTYVMNVVASILVLSPLSSYVVRSAIEANVEPRQIKALGVLSSPEFATPSESKPDIYYLVLDGYGRSDMLKDKYAFDNSAFMEVLETHGFYVATESTANYPQTLLSLASSLNFTYLDEVFPKEAAGYQDRAPLRRLIQNNRAAATLAQAGYRNVSFSTVFYDADMPDADLYVHRTFDLRPFEASLIEFTPILRMFSAFGKELLFDLHRGRTLFSLRKLAEMPNVEGPKFVFFHIFVGHPPFLFRADGSSREATRPYSWREGNLFLGQPGATREEYIEGYREQVAYLNTVLADAIDSILRNSAQPPIVIVQGDHGPGLGLDSDSLESTDVRERYSILNAYYLPGGADAPLYSSISPVNSFRMILNQYFGLSLPLLPDRSVFAPTEFPYDFQEVPVSYLSRSSGDLSQD